MRWHQRWATASGLSPKRWGLRLTVWLTEKETDMWLILLEALGAGLILVLIVWWTMAGRADNEDDKPE